MVEIYSAPPPEVKKTEVFTKGEEYSAEPVIEKSFGAWWYKFCQVTRDIEGKRLTFPMRRERADLYKKADEVRDTPIGSEERKRYLLEVAEHKRIEREFVNQMDLKVETPWGEQEAKFTVLNREAPKENPIVIIPGSSNGVESVDSLVRAMAKRYPNRRIILIGYPDAPSGKVTKEFFDAVTTANGFEPHSVYFTNAITQLSKDFGFEDFELGSYSGGGGITQELLSNSKLSDRITNSWMMCPSGSVEMNSMQFNLGIVHENGNLLKKLKELPRYVFVDDKTKDEQKQMKFKMWMELGVRCCRNIIDKQLGLMRVKENGKIAVLSGADDLITRSAWKFNGETLPFLKEKQPNLDATVIPNAPHADPLLEPEVWLDELDRMLGR